MKSIKIALGVLIVSVLVISGAVFAAPNNGKGEFVRVIAETTSSLKKMKYKALGCKIVHELKDATALKCPPGVAAGLKDVREDRIFHIVDIEADIQIHADDVWAQGITGTGVNVAVLDTGIDTEHPEFEDSIVGCVTCVDGTTTCEDDHGHGTHVSGIITANGLDGNAKGVAPGAGIYMYKVCDENGRCYESDMMEAMEAAVLTDAKVMSISIGGGNCAEEDCDGDPLADKVNWVVNEGITVAIAAGNDRFFVSYAACASEAIAVGAVDKSGLMANFSNFGPSLDIVAPGVSIYSPIIDVYASWSGTSMATPHVAGVVALMLDANPDLTVEDIKTALYDTADPIDPDSTCYGVQKVGKAGYRIVVVECTSDNYGAGIVDASGAVDYVLPTVGCSSHGDCDDNNECTTDTCINNSCENIAVEEDTSCGAEGSGICCDGECSAAACTEDSNCDDGNECTVDICYNKGTCSAYCGYTDKDDGISCSGGGICCSGTCAEATCSTDADCDDAESCTIDTCTDAGTCSASCSNTWDVDCCLPWNARCTADEECCSENCRKGKCR